MAVFFPAASRWLAYHTPALHTSLCVGEEGGGGGYMFVYM